MVAGRSASALLLVTSLICTWIGAGSLIGGGGRAYREGLSQLWMSAGAWVGIVIIYFLADRVRRINQFTVQDILEKRYHPSARVLGSIAVILGSTIIFAYQLRGIAFVIEFLFQIPQIWGIIITGSVLLVLTSMAGLKSILAMDMLNGTLIILAVFVGLPIMLMLVGGDGAGSAGSISDGVAHVKATLPAAHFSALGGHDFVWAFGVFFPTFFLLLGESSIYQKFFSARSAGSVKRAVLGFLVGVIVVEVILTLFAVTASTHPETHSWRTTHAEYVEAAEAEAPTAELDQKWDALITAVTRSDGDDNIRPADATESIERADRLYKNRTDAINLESAFYLPIWAGALFLAAALAIIFSTGNSFMMAASTSFTRDIWQRFIRPDSTQEQMVWVQRIVMVALVAFAVSILTVFTTVWQMALAAYTIIGATLTPVILAAFLWRRVTRAAGVASLAVSITIWVVMVWMILTGRLEMDFDYIVYFAGGGSILTLILVSFLTQPPSQEVIDEFMG